jgi:hypothetical protein
MVKARNKSNASGTSLPLSSAVPDELPKEEQVTWKDRLLKASNIASILCVIDCTVLPIVTVVLPLLGLAAFTPAQMEWLHHFGTHHDRLAASACSCLSLYLLFVYVLL